MNDLISKNLNLKELDLTEKNSISGGGLKWIVEIGLAIGVSAWESWEDIRQGWSDGNSGKPPRHNK